MYQTILFDLDGTLTDPKPGITKSVQYALAKMGIEEPDSERLTPFIGPPLGLAFKEFYQMNDQEAKQAVAYYRERFSVVGLYENAVYPGISELLKQLKSLDKTLLVATSKPTVFAVKILEHFAIDEFFTHVVGSNLDGTLVEKSEVIAFALNKIGVYRKDNVLMVGDRKHDVLGAKENGIDAVAVAYGYGPLAELTDSNPKYIVQTIEDLATLLIRE